jgi:hypothetical protein
MAKVQIMIKSWIRAGVNRILKHGYYLSTYCVVIVCILLGLFYAGCTGDRETNDVIDFRLNLNNPEIEGREVTVNGGVAVPIEQIQWDWGDGQIDEHHFFPASHTFNKPGSYEIKVIVFDSKKRTATKSVTVEIR